MDNVADVAIQFLTFYTLSAIMLFLGLEKNKNSIIVTFIDSTN